MNKVCSVDGCNLIETRLGYCHKHYFRLYRNGTLELQKRKLKIKKLCSVDGCNNNSYCKGFCKKHKAFFDRNINPITIIIKNRHLNIKNSYGIKIKGDKKRTNNLKK